MKLDKPRRGTVVRILLLVFLLQIFPISPSQQI